MSVRNLQGECRIVFMVCFNGKLAGHSYLSRARKLVSIVPNDINSCAVCIYEQSSFEIQHENIVKFVV